MIALRPLTLDTARRLAISRQHLDAPRAPATSENIFEIIRDLGCVQLDPLRTVERSHRLVVFSRVGPHDHARFDALLFQEKKLFEYWAHAASIVPTEDFPLHHALMRRYQRGETVWGYRARNWMTANRALKNYILKRIRVEGALPSRLLHHDGIDPKTWVSTGWTSDRNVSRMLDFLWTQGTLMVAGREGIQKRWDLSERVLPAWTPREKLSEREVTYRAAQRALRALGVATPQQIQQHFIRHRYTDLPGTLAQLEREGCVARIELRNGKRAMPGNWFIHADDLARAEKIERGEWAGRTTLLSPFDNLTCDRKRTRLLWNFDYTIEIYTPAAKRKFGYYVLQILRGDALIGRIDPQMDRENARLNIHAVFAERGAPRAAGREIADAIRELGTFLDAREITFTLRVPAMWRKELLS